MLPRQVEQAVSSVQLSPEQLQVMQRVQAGHSLFFTGPAGTGKSVLLREIVKWYREQGKSLDVTASTGVASINIGGTTLHSWAGVSLGKESVPVLLMRILGKEEYLRRKRTAARSRRNLPLDPKDIVYSAKYCDPQVVKRWKECQALVIDESGYQPP